MATAAGVRIDRSNLEDMIEATDTNLSLITIDQQIGSVSIVFSVAGGVIQKQGAVQGAAPATVLRPCAIGGGASGIVPEDCGGGGNADWVIGVAGVIGTKAHIEATLR